MAGLVQSVGGLELIWVVQPASRVEGAQVVLPPKAWEAVVGSMPAVRQLLRQRQHIVLEATWLVP